jgi:hypothetical protein
MLTQSKFVIAETGDVLRRRKVIFRRERGGRGA